MDGTGWGTSPLVQGGFLIAQSDGGAAVDITDCQCYDVWDQPPSIEFDPTGYPGGLFVAVANLGAGVVPSANIPICDVEFCGVSLGSSTITIDTDPQWDTWVAQDLTIYDPTIDSAVVAVEVGYIPPCECYIDGPISVRASGLLPRFAQYTAIPDQNCSEVPIYQYSTTCYGESGASIDPNTGLLTVPPYVGFNYNCEVCALDTANTDINTGDPVECCLNIEIWSDW
jgi:hypothetical protein